MFLNRRVRNKSNLTAKCAKTANKNGSFPRKPLLHSQKVFAQREPSLPCLKSPATGAFPLSSILPTVVTQNLRKFLWPVSPCSCRSRRSRFMILKRSVRCNFHRETRENREQNGSVPSSPPCSYRSRCSRFMFLKRSVRCISDGKISAKHAKIANKKRKCPQEDGPLRCCGLVSVEC